MIILKRIGKFLVNNILFLLMLSLIFSITLKQVITKDVVRKVVYNKIAENAKDVLNNNINGLEYADINRIKKELENNKDLNDMVEKYTDVTINSVANNDYSNIELNKDLKSVIKNNKGIIEKEYNVNISDDEIDKAIDEYDKKYDINNTYKNAVKKASNNLSKGQRQVLKLYKTITATKFIIINIILIVLTIIIIAIYKRSFYKWLKNISISGITSSIINAIIYSLFIMAINLSVKDLNLNIISSLQIPIIFLISSIAIFIIYKVIDMKNTNTK